MSTTQAFSTTPQARESGAPALSRDDFIRLAMGELDAVDRVAKSLCRDKAEAEDLVQETYLRALRAHESFKLHEFGIRPWLLRILHNVRVNRVKREYRQPMGVDAEQLDAATAPPEAPPPMIGGKFNDDEINRAMDQLPPDLRTILIMWAVDELSYKEMAQVLDVPLGTVMSRVHRARQRLAEILPRPN